MLSVPGEADPVASRLRAGSRALLLLADSVSVAILLQLGSGPLENAELLERIGFVSRSTYFERMRSLEDLSLLSRTRRGDVPPVAECRLRTSGVRLLPVARRVDAWLANAPSGPLKLGDAYATTAVKSLGIAWGSTLLRWLSEQPRTLSELGRLVHVFGYRKLERIVRELIEVGLIEPVASRGRLRSYRITEWGRSSASPLTAAMRWEQGESAKWASPVSSIEAKGVLLLALPLVGLSEGANGSCALLVDGNAPEKESLGGVLVRWVDGQPVSWKAVGEHEVQATEYGADCWVRGTTAAWLGPRGEEIFEVEGNAALAEAVMDALRAEYGFLETQVANE